MTLTLTLPYGTWPSPISAASVAAQSLRLSAVTIDGDDIYWLEGRPSEGGRNVLVRRTSDGATRDVTPAPFNVRTRVHEYGGGAYLVDRGTVWFSNFADQRVYRLDGRSGRARGADTPRAPGSTPTSVFDRARRRLIAVREDHTVAGQRSGHDARGDRCRGRPHSVLTGARLLFDAARSVPDGSALAWICWDHPQMPWDGTELWVARFDDGWRSACTERASPADRRSRSTSRDGRPTARSSSRAIAPAGGSCIVRTHRRRRCGRCSPHAPAESEFGRPQWTFGTATWAFAGESRAVVSFTRKGVWQLAVVDAVRASHRALDVGLDPQEWIAATARARTRHRRVAAAGGRPRAARTR